MGLWFQSLTAEKVEQSVSLRSIMTMWWQPLHCGGPGSREHPEEIGMIFNGGLPSPDQWPASAAEALLLKSPQPLKILPTAGETIPRHT